MAVFQQGPRSESDLKTKQKTKQKNYKDKQYCLLLRFIGKTADDPDQNGRCWAMVMKETAGRGICLTSLDWTGTWMDSSIFVSRSEFVEFHKGYFDFGHDIVHL